MEEITRKGKSKSNHYIQVSNATSGLKYLSQEIQGLEIASA